MFHDTKMNKHNIRYQCNFLSYVAHDFAHATDN
jgi:hypothetical protein